MTMSKPKADTQTVEPEGPDGGWGWVLVGALFVSIGLVFGLVRSMGIFFVEFIQYFGESAQAVSWITSTGVAALQFISPVAAALCNAYNARVVVITGGILAGVGLILATQATSLLHLYLSMGVISGLGWGLVITPMLASVIASFTRRRSLAVGLAFSSVGLSAFAFNPLFQMLVEMYAWRGALLIVGGLSFNIIACGAVICVQKTPQAPAKVMRRSTCAGMLQGISSYLELSLLCERPFLTYTLAITFTNVGFFVPYVHLVAHSRQVGFSEYQAAFIMSAGGVADILGRIVSGWFADLGNFRMIHLLAMWMSLAGVFIVLLPVSSMTGSYPGLMVVSLLYGFTSGALTSLVFSVMPKIVGLKRLAGGLGLLQLLESGGGLVGVPLSGWLRDKTGNYTASFVVAGSFFILGALTMATLPHFFSCTDPPPPQGQSKNPQSELGLMAQPAAITDTDDDKETQSKSIVGAATPELNGR
ncbi:monocarboxylate transporter 13-like [Genypterus blacodes]|uniref:monocarboxylate transporter 13-like n=1 Tax=Genypterus blacodes TaxID=154954 RepID=UPI003F774961